MKYRVFTWTDSEKAAYFFKADDEWIRTLKNSEFYRVNGRIVSLLKKHVGNDVQYDAKHSYYYVSRDSINAIKRFLDSQECLNSKTWRDGKNHLHVSYRPKLKEISEMEITLVGED